jgi:putative Holliday junction resolvase
VSGRTLGIDPGTKRIGVALSVDGIVATPLETLAASTPDDDARAIARLAAERDVSRIVVGHPRRLDGTAGPAALAAESLADKIRAHSAVPVSLWDERLTTVEAERALIARGVRRRRRRAAVDRTAATVMLQSFLDAEANAP